MHSPFGPWPAKILNTMVMTNTAAVPAIGEINKQLYNFDIVYPLRCPHVCSEIQFYLLNF